MKNLIILCLMFVSVNIFAQDFIILKNGEEIEAKVLEINEHNIDYKKYSNINGPTYHINKSEIFMIKYESGDKDIFNTSGTVREKAPAKTIYSKPNDFVYNPNIGTPNCQTQKERGAKIFGNRANEVFFRQDLVYYGYDMTYARLSNPKKMGESMILIQKYFNDFGQELEKNVGYSEFKKWMRKSSMLLGNSVFSNYYKRDFNKFVEYGNYCISFNDLQKIIESYVIRESQGIGMVINVVNFNKDREFSMQYITFFDIKTREILYALLTTGEAGGGGFVGHWAKGVEDGVRAIFVDEVFKRKVSNSGMLPSKLRLY